MAGVHDDRFAVFIRYDAGNALTPDEQPVAFCATYHEARRLRQALQGSPAGDYVIRFEGATGGGD
jgi:hypothetical protein